MDINVIAMEVIINACKGRDMIEEAISCMMSDQFEEAEKILEEAEEYMLKAHVAQTQTIQSQAGGENMEYSLLFIHAQDTIMTSNSELRMMKRLLPVFKLQTIKVNQLLKGEI